MKPTVVAFLWLALAGACVAYSYEEKLVVGLLPEYHQPPFEAVRELNTQVSCCAQGIPLDWPQGNTSAFELAERIVSIDPSVYDVAGGRLLVNRTGSARVFILTQGRVPEELRSADDCRTDLTRTWEEEGFSAWIEGNSSQLAIASQEHEKPVSVPVAIGQTWNSDWPPENETTFRFDGLPEGNLSLAASYRVQANYSSVHYRITPHKTCYLFGCSWDYTCDYAYSEDRVYSASENDSQEIVVLPEPQATAKFFLDGNANKLKLFLDAPGSSSWALEAGSALAYGSSFEYAFNQVILPYNFSRVIAVPRPTAFARGFSILKGSLEPARANAVLALPQDIPQSNLTISTPFEQENFTQSPQATQSELSARAIVLSNGTSLLLATLSSQGTPLAGENVTVQWRGNSVQLATGPDGVAQASSGNATGSQAQVYYDSDGRYASASTLAVFEAPRSNLGLEEEVLFFLGAIALVGAGVALATGHSPATLMPWLPKAVIGGLALWIIARTVSS